MITLTISKNKKYGNIVGSKQDIDLARNFFSVKNPAFRSNLPFIQSRIFAITPNGKFDLGLVSLIKKFFIDKGIEILEDKDLLKFNTSGIKNPNIIQLDISLRDYQEKSVYNAVENGCGIIVLPTAAGKTLTAATLIKTMSNYIPSKSIKTLVLVPSIQLVEQTARDFEEYGLTNISKWSGSSELDKKSSIIIAGSQKLLSEKTDKSILGEIDIFIIDEAHTLRRGNKLNKLFNFINTPHKFGFTGTMPSSLIDQWNIIGKLGPIVYEEKTINLKNQKYIADFKVVILKLKHQKISFNYDSSSPVDLYNKELDFLISNQRRNLIISNLALKLRSNTIIMVDRILHGELIFEELKKLNKSNVPIYFIQGSTELDEREQIRSLMSQNSSTIVVAISKIFSTGINIPSIQNIIFALTGKAKIKIMQSIGRALRLHPLKNKATIFDVADNLKYSKLHLEERKDLYKAENYFYEEKEL